MYSNVWFLSVLFIYLNSNTSIIFKKKKILNYFFQKNVKRVILSHIQKGKKEKSYSHYPFVLKYLIHICIFIYLYSNTSIIFI